MVEVRKCSCGWGDVQRGFSERSGLVNVCVHLLFFFAVISPVSLEHTCWGCSVSCKHKNTNVQNWLHLKYSSHLIFPKTQTSHRWEDVWWRKGWNRMINRRREEKDRGGAWVHPGWLMSCWRIIPTWAGREWEGDRKGESEENEICWSGDDNLGRGQKAYPPSHLEKGSEGGGGGGGVHPLESS